MSGQQQYTPEMMDAHAQKTASNSDQMHSLFMSIKSDVENLKATGGWVDASVDRVIEQIAQLLPGMNNLHSTLQNHAQVTRKQAASARQLSTSIH